METNPEKPLDNPTGCGCDCHSVHHAAGDTQHNSGNEELLSDCYCEGDRYENGAKCFAVGVIGCIVMIVIMIICC